MRSSPSTATGLSFVLVLAITRTPSDVSLASLNTRRWTVRFWRIAATSCRHMSVVSSHSLRSTLSSEWVSLMYSARATMHGRSSRAPRTRTERIPSHICMPWNTATNSLLFSFVWLRSSERIHVFPCRWLAIWPAHITFKAHPAKLSCSMVLGMCCSTLFTTAGTRQLTNDSCCSDVIWLHADCRAAQVAAGTCREDFVFVSMEIYTVSTWSQFSKTPARYFAMTSSEDHVILMERMWRHLLVAAASCRKWDNRKWWYWWSSSSSSFTVQSGCSRHKHRPCSVFNDITPSVRMISLLKQNYWHLFLTKANTYHCYLYILSI